MEREEFLSKLGIGVVAVCAGCAFASCGSKANDATPAGTPAPAPGSGGTFITADLATELTSIGTTKVAGGIILARISAGSTAASFTAVQVACTHEGNSINYNAGQGLFICPAHGSEFATNGTVILGPATTNLQRYTITITGNALTVS